MDLIVRLGEREEEVRVCREGDGWRVTVGKRTYDVDAEAARPGLSSLLIEGGQHEVAVRRQDEASWWVSAAGGACTVEVADPLSRLARLTRGAEAGRRKQKATAYMPGRVVTLLASPGDEVAAGQGVLVLEAMKMENELKAPRDGTIASIRVQEGQGVEGGALLATIE